MLCCGGAPARVEPAAQWPGAEQAVLQAIGRARLEYRLGALRPDAAIASLARGHSRAMAQGERGFDHGGFDARVEWLVHELGVSAASENLLEASARRPDELAPLAIASWLHSPPHRENLLGAWTRVGVGIAQGPPGRYYVTAIFVRGAAPASDRIAPGGRR